MSEEYDIRKSEKDVGQLYPVLLDKKGRVIDGLHRLNVDPKWKAITLRHIDSEEKFLKARIISNLHRRTVPASEIRAWLNDLAKIALKKGIKVGEISEWIAEETGYASHTVRDYLEDKYKIETGPKGVGVGMGMSPRDILPSLAEAEEKLGRKTFQRFKADLREEVKQELRKDPEFIVETIEKAPVVLPTLPKPAVDRGGYYVPAITKREAKELERIQIETEEALRKRRSSPAVQERGKLVKNWMAHGNVISVAGSLSCPICGSDATHLVWTCHPDLNIYESKELVKKKLEKD